VHAPLSHVIVTNARIQRRDHDLGSRPRLWWCPAGPFAELPLHAAGVYRGTRQDCLANYVVSSYTPTLSALVNAQSAATIDRPRDQSNVLVVSVPDAPGLPSLPNAQVEVDRICDIMPSASLTTLSGNQACLESILKALIDVTVLHLACHGQQSQDNPLTSGFVLSDGRLTLERLMELHLPHAELAYLSACETASTDEYQPDEAINLAATMLFVGFKSVIATMWYVPRKRR
jgi:CHAT domain-containing protein